MAVAGIDVGGTKCLAVALDPAGTVVAELRRPTPPGPDLLDALVSLVAALDAELGAPVDAVGVGVPGLVDRRGTLRAAPNVRGVSELAVGPGLARAVGRPVTVDNDATCALAAEWHLGAARGVDEVLLVTLGTGIGGAMVLGGRLQHGVNGFSGEVGHMVVHPEGPRCPCGRRGCWERYASGAGLGRLAREAAEAGQLDAAVALAGDVDAVRGEHLSEAARAGDGEALAVVERFAAWVALGLANLTNVVDPALILIGGGLADAGDLLVAPIRAAFADALYAPEHRPHPRIEAARLGGRAGALGAALLARPG